MPAGVCPGAIENMFLVFFVFLKGCRPKTPFSVFEPILYCYICTITTGFYIRNTLYYEGSYGDFLPACHLLPQEGMEKHCFFFTIVIQAFRSLLLLPLLLLPTAAAAPSFCIIISYDNQAFIFWVILEWFPNFWNHVLNKVGQAIEMAFVNGELAT